MKTIHPISICFLLLGSILWAQTGSPKPNVLFISIDDLNDWVGFMDGHPQAKTPHMDALAKSGRNFTNAHCSVPVCTSSRNSVMSGIGPDDAWQL
jgi:arylsulfatase A-like enzyme